MYQGSYKEWDLAGDLMWELNSNTNSASTSGKKKQVGSSRQEVSNSNPFEALTSVENDGDLGTNGGNSKVDEKGANSDVLILVDDDEKSLNKVDYALVNSDSDSDVEVAYDKTAQFMASAGENDANLYEDEDYDIYGTYHINGLTKQE
ncbi:hypothetical protein Tco_1237905 [Tanacetum coccineum]